MSEKKNYNINTLRGVLNDDDMDVCETLGLDPSLAYTPGMVQACSIVTGKQRSNLNV